MVSDGKGFPTLPSFGASIGLMLKTGEHSVMPYPSRMVPDGDFTLKRSAISCVHFSAHTTAYRILARSPEPACDRIILRKVGVAVTTVAWVCFRSEMMVPASFGSGVKTVRSPVMSGRIVLMVNQKLWKGGRKERIDSFFESGKSSSDHRMQETRFAWVSETAFGRLSLPDVNRITAVSDFECGYRLSFDCIIPEIFSPRVRSLRRSSR